MHHFNKDIGNFGENLAETYLKQNGYKILTKNFTCKIGEIDIIGIDKNLICFIEVKTRYNLKYGYPCEAVTRNKMMKIYKSSQVYILKNRLFKYSFRFDIIEILLDKKNKPKIRLIKNAFQV